MLGLIFPDTDRAVLELTVPNRPPNGFLYENSYFPISWYADPGTLLVPLYTDIFLTMPVVVQIRICSLSVPYVLYF